MAVGNRKNLKRKKNLTPKETSKVRKRNRTSSKVFHGLKFQSSPKLDFIKTTTFRSRPNIVFNAGDMRNILIDYSVSTSDEDHQLLNTFFTVLKEGKSTFNIKKGTAEYVNELKTQKTKNLEISFTFLKLLDGNKILARANDDMEVIDDLYLGKYFIKTPQIVIKESPDTKKRTSKILNFTQSPSFTELDVRIGDTLEFKGTENNNISVTVLSDLVVRDESGREEILVTAVNSDESLIGTPVTVDYFRKRQNDIIKEDISADTSSGQSQSITSEVTVARNDLNMTENEVREMERLQTSAYSTQGRMGSRDRPTVETNTAASPPVNPSTAYNY